MPEPTPEEKQAELKESIDALSEITNRLRKGSTIAEVQTAFEAHEFPVLERKTSQMAILSAVEKSSTDVINVQEVVAQNQESVDQTDVGGRKKSLAKIGLTAFMTAVIKEPAKVDEIISTLHFEDFSHAQAEKQYARLVLESREMDVAQVFYLMRFGLS